MDNKGVMRRQSQRIKEKTEKKLSQGQEGQLESPPANVAGLPLAPPSAPGKQPKAKGKKTLNRKGQVGHETLQQPTTPVNEEAPEKMKKRRGRPAKSSPSGLQTSKLSTLTAPPSTPSTSGTQNIVAATSAGTSNNKNPHGVATTAANPAPVAGPSTSALPISTNGGQGGQPGLSLETPKAMSKSQKRKRKDGNYTAKQPNKNKRPRKQTAEKQFTTRDRGVRASTRPLTTIISQEDTTFPLSEKHLREKQEKLARDGLNKELENKSKNRRKLQRKPEFMKEYITLIKRCSSKREIQIINKKILYFIRGLIQDEAASSELNMGSLNESNVPEESENLGSTAAETSTETPDNRNEQEVTITVPTENISNNVDTVSTDVQASSSKIPGTTRNAEEQVGLSHPQAPSVLHTESTLQITENLDLTEYQNPTVTVHGVVFDKIILSNFLNIMHQNLLQSLNEDPQFNGFEYDVIPWDVVNAIVRIVYDANPWLLIESYNNFVSTNGSIIYSLTNFPWQYNRYYFLYNSMNCQGSTWALGQLGQPQQQPLLTSVSAAEESSHSREQQSNTSAEDNLCRELVPLGYSEHDPGSNPSAVSGRAEENQQESCTPLVDRQEISHASGDSNSSREFKMGMGVILENNSLNETSLGKIMEPELIIPSMNCPEKELKTTDNQLSIEIDNSVLMELDEDLGNNSLNKNTANEDMEVDQTIHERSNNVEKRSSRKRCREEDIILPHPKRLCRDNLKRRYQMKISDENEGHPSVSLSMANGISLSNTCQGQVEPPQQTEVLDIENEEEGPSPKLAESGMDDLDKNHSKSAEPEG